jgi:hypothetical protein
MLCQLPATIGTTHSNDATTQPRMKKRAQRSESLLCQIMLAVTTPMNTSNNNTPAAWSMSASYLPRLRLMGFASRTPGPPIELV